MMTWGMSLSAEGYLCGLISDTPFHPNHASFLQQSMGHSEVVKTTRCGHSVLSNAFRWYSTTFQHLNLDFDGKCAGTGSDTGFTLCDRTVNLDPL